MTVAGYDAGLVQSVASTLNLRTPNADALDALAKAIDAAPHGAELVADLATGVGKTYVAGALLDYLYESGVRHVVIVTPGSTIQRKTLDNLTAGRPKYLQGLQCRPVVITLDDFERGIVGQALADASKLKVFVLTVQSLLRPETKENRRAHREHETLGRSLTDHLRDADDLVIIADEHHVYFSGNARKFQAAITELDPAVLIGLTATPHESTPRERIVYRYPLAEAIADGYVKIPVLVARPEGFNDTRTQLTDGVALLNAKRAAMRAHCGRTGQGFVEPVLFVVAQTIDEAHRMRDLLVGPDLLGEPRAVLLVTSAEPEETLRALDGIEDPGSGVRAVVSVSMLKEGWDVKNIYVIAAVRALESLLLTEQILGRGLRLPFAKRTGVAILDSVEVLSHRKFSELLERDDVLLDQTPGQRARQAVADTATVQARLEQAATTQQVLSTLYVARALAGVQLPLQIPRVTVRWERTVFSLRNADLADVETLGAQFGRQPGSAHHPRLPSGPIESELVIRLLVSNDVAATGTEASAAAGVARAFLAGVRAVRPGGKVTAQVPWHADQAEVADQAEMAAQALIGWLRTQQARTPARRVTEVEQVSWPDPPSTTLTLAPASRHLLTDSRSFSPGQPYFGWTRSVFEVISFDTYSTQFRLAEIFDASPDVTAWLRITPEVPLTIGYTVGAGSRLHRPDFLVIDDSDLRWVVQGSPDAELTSPVTAARRDAAQEWVAAVNASAEVPARWSYLLASESAITTAAGSWAAVKAANQTFG